MADTKKAATDPVAGLQAKADVELAQGFIGDKADPLPNTAYSQESGQKAAVKKQ